MGDIRVFPVKFFLKLGQLRQVPPLIRRPVVVETTDGKETLVNLEKATNGTSSRFAKNLL